MWREEDAGVDVADVDAEGKRGEVCRVRDMLRSVSARQHKDGGRQGALWRRMYAMPGMCAFLSASGYGAREARYAEGASVSSPRGDDERFDERRKIAGEAKRGRGLVKAKMRPT